MAVTPNGRCGRLSGVFLVGGQPTHKRAQLGPYLLDLLCVQGLAPLEEVRPAAVEFLDKLGGERAVADLAEDAAHLVDAAPVDDPRAPGIAAELRRVRDRPVHLGQPALVHEVDDQLHLMQALEVGHLGLVTGLDQGVESRLDQLGDSAAEHDLLTEQVGLRLLGEGGGQRTGPGATDRLGVGQGERPRLARRVALDGDQHRNAPALGELAAHQVTRSLRGDHADVHAGGWGDELVADVQPVGEEQGVALDQAGRDRLRVECALYVIGREDHDQVRLLAGLLRGQHRQPLTRGGGPAARAVRQAYPDVHAGVTQGQRMGVSLAAVAQHRHVPVLDDSQVGLVVIENVCHCLPFAYCAAGPAAARSSGRSARSVMDLLPRPRATMPDCTSSLMPNGSSTLIRASSLSRFPVASTVTASCATSTTLARKSATVSSTRDRLSASARTLTSRSSRWTDTDGSSSTIFRTLISLLSCLVTCSSGWSAQLTTIVIREISSCSVGPTASESMLKPRRENRPAARTSTPGLFSTSTDSVCLLAAGSCSRRRGAMLLIRSRPNPVPCSAPPRCRRCWFLPPPSATPSRHGAPRSRSRPAGRRSSWPPRSPRRRSPRPRTAAPRSRRPRRA